MNNQHPDLAMANQFLGRLDPKRVFTFQTFPDQKGRSASASPKVLHGTLDQHADALIRANVAGSGIFVMINEGDGVILPGSKTCRTNDNIVRIRSLFCDLDGAPLEPILQAPLAPHIIVESSPGKWHAYWLTSDTRLDQFRGLQQALAKKYNGDSSVCDLARVMRLPGFYHHKGPPVMTRLIKH